MLDLERLLHVGERQILVFVTAVVEPTVDKSCSEG